jgi:hypothetical protein
MKSGEIIALVGVGTVLAAGTLGGVVIITKQKADAAERAQALELERLRLQQSTSSGTSAPKLPGGLNLSNIINTGKKLANGAKDVASVVNGLKGFLGL